MGLFWRLQCGLRWFIGCSCAFPATFAVKDATGVCFVWQCSHKCCLGGCRPALIWMWPPCYTSWHDALHHERPTSVSSRLLWAELFAFKRINLKNQFTHTYSIERPKAEPPERSGTPGRPMIKPMEPFWEKLNQHWDNTCFAWHLACSWNLLTVSHCLLRLYTQCTTRTLGSDATLCDPRCGINMLFEQKTYFYTYNIYIYTYLSLHIILT